MKKYIIPLTVFASLLLFSCAQEDIPDTPITINKITSNYSLDTAGVVYLPSVFSELNPGVKIIIKITSPLRRITREINNEVYSGIVLNKTEREIYDSLEISSAGILELMNTEQTEIAIDYHGEVPENYEPVKKTIIIKFTTQAQNNQTGTAYDSEAVATEVKNNRIMLPKIEGEEGERFNYYLSPVIDSEKYIAVNATLSGSCEKITGTNPPQNNNIGLWVASETVYPVVYNTLVGLGEPLIAGESQTSVTQPIVSVAIPECPSSFFIQANLTIIDSRGYSFPSTINYEIFDDLISTTF